MLVDHFGNGCRTRGQVGSRASVTRFSSAVIGCGRILILLLLPMLAPGCPMAAPGVTTGGQQDIAAARRAILDGDVPDPASITVEGFLSEHSIEIEPPADAGLLYAVATTAWNSDFDAFTPLATLQIGFGTTLEPGEIERSDLNLCLVIDRSGSMGDSVDQRTGTSKLEAVKVAIDRLLAKLTADDLVSVVVFDSQATRIVRGAAGTDIATIKGALDDVTSGGGTDLANGLRRGFNTVRELSDGVRSDRIFVFTDALLSSRSETRARAFLDTMSSFADLGIGATVFGVGTQFGHEVAFDIAQIRGGNYFFLSDYDRIVGVFDDEFEYLVTPIAYDVTIAVDVPFAFDVAEVYGIPAEAPFPHALELHVPTLFLSTREGGGAVLIRIRPGALVNFDSENVLATVDMTYETPDGAVEAIPQITATLPAGLNASGDPPYFETVGTQRGVLLLNTSLVLKRACEDVFPTWYYRYDDSTRDVAIQRLSEFLPYFDELATGLADQPTESSRSLSQERSLVSQLLANIEARRF